MVVQSDTRHKCNSDLHFDVLHCEVLIWVGWNQRNLQVTQVFALVTAWLTQPREAKWLGEESTKTLLSRSVNVQLSTNACAHLFVILICMWELSRVGQHQITRRKGGKKTETQEGGGAPKKKEKKQPQQQTKWERDGEIDWERKAMKHYLFWQPPSPPRSSEKFLRFHQHQLNHKEKRHSPITTDWEKRGSDGGVQGGGGAGADRKSDSTLFSPLLLMATNLIICLHSGAAETCSLTYTLTLAHSPARLPALSLFLFPISLSLSHSLPPCPAQTKPSSTLIHKGRALVSWCSARQWRSWEPCLPLWEMALDGDK